MVPASNALIQEQTYHLGFWVGAQVFGCKPALHLQYSSTTQTQHLLKHTQFSLFYTKRSKEKCRRKFVIWFQSPWNGKCVQIPETCMNDGPGTFLQAAAALDSFRSVFNTNTGEILNSSRELSWQNIWVKHYIVFGVVLAFIILFEFQCWGDVDVRTAPQ